MEEILEPEPPNCLFCDCETLLKSNCKKQRWSVCKQHFMIQCPICGHEAFFLPTKQHPKGRYCCFRVSPFYCDWVSDTLPEE